MAAVTSSAVSFLSFSGLKAGASSTKPATAPRFSVSGSTASKLTVKASWKDVGAAVVATAAGAILASNALAFEVKLGRDDGALVFDPQSFVVPAGEKIVFKNIAGFPHNVVFDEDEVPAGVDVSKISMLDDDYLNAADEVYSVTLTEPGTYSFYCAPHQGAGMVGKVTVQ